MDLIEIEIFPKAQSAAVKAMKSILGDVMIVPNLAPIEALKKSLQVLAPKMAPSAVKNFEAIIQQATSNAMSAALQAQKRVLSQSPVARSFDAGRNLVGSAGAGIGRAAGAVVNSLPGIGGIAKAAGAASAAFTGILGPIGMLIGFITSIVEAADPGIVEQLMLAFKEIWGVIGQALLPVIEALIPLVQAVGELFATLTPILKPIIWVFQLLAKIITSIVRAFSWLVGKTTGEGVKSARGSTTQQASTVGIEALGKSFHVAGFQRNVDWQRAMVMTAEHTRQTASNTRRRDDNPTGPGNG